MPNERTDLPILHYLQLLLKNADTTFAPDLDDYPEDADLLGPATTEMYQIATAITNAEAFCDLLEQQLEELGGKRKTAAATIIKAELLLQEDYLSLLRRMLDIAVRSKFSTATAEADHRTFFFVDSDRCVRMAQHTLTSSKTSRHKTPALSRRKMPDGTWVN